MTKLSKKIMRRVYYAFCLRLITHPVSLHTMIIVSGVFALSKVVSIPSIWANLMQVKVGEVAGFFFGALANTQLIVILWLSVIAAALISLTIKLFSDRRFEVIDTEAEWV